MKTIIAGGRDYILTDADIQFLNGLIEEITEVVSGGAVGADKGGGELWAKAHGIPVKVIKAEWATDGRAAGPRRNALMAQYADAVILFPGGRGTESMARIAKRGGLKIIDRRVEK